VVELPVSPVTSVAFGGDELTDLYVTTSRAGLGATDLAGQPHAGAVFCVQAVGVRGRRADEFAR
jgi:sugar lactone lactonase YvrE